MFVQKFCCSPSLASSCLLRSARRPVTQSAYASGDQSTQRWDPQSDRSASHLGVLHQPSVFTCGLSTHETMETHHHSAQAQGRKLLRVRELRSRWIVQTLCSSLSLSLVRACVTFFRVS